MFLPHKTISRDFGQFQVNFRQDYNFNWNKDLFISYFLFRFNILFYYWLFLYSCLLKLLINQFLYLSEMVIFHCFLAKIVFFLPSVCFLSHKTISGDFGQYCPKTLHIVLLERKHPHQSKITLYWIANSENIYFRQE